MLCQVLVYLTVSSLGLLARSESFVTYTLFLFPTHCNCLHYASRTFKSHLFIMSSVIALFLLFYLYNMSIIVIVGM
jgi:hypothetical protein